MTNSQTPEIIVYTHPDCAYSAAVKWDYDNQGIEYTEIDISVTPESIEALEKLTGGDHITPVVVNGDKVSIGFNGIG